jgi:Nucleotide-diphospho-sugar transferase
MGLSPRVSCILFSLYFQNFHDIPLAAASRYGDRKFVAMMMAKLICVQLVSMLGYDFLFQDVDIVWFKNPMEYFTKIRNETEYDVVFQDDGGHSVRYAPYAANTGFYYVKHNALTRHFLTSLLMAGDVVVSTHSHQQVLIAFLNEHVSLFGLKAKVIPRSDVDFPGGFHFHQGSQWYMRKFFRKIYNPYIFHMSWTLNKDNKLAFFRQLGEWYVHDKCIDKKVQDVGQITSGNADSVSASCCSTKAIFSCHYRDKPSIKPCRKSPPIDKGRKSWW